MERLEEFYRNMFCNPKMKEVEILTNSIKLSENDKIICGGENSGKQIRLFSQSLMVINQADGECLQQFYPVRSLQSSYGTGYDNGAAAKYCSDFNVGYHREI